MGEVKQKQFKKKGKTKKKILLIFGVLVVVLIAFGIKSEIWKIEDPTFGILDGIGKEEAPKGVAKDQIRTKLKNMGYKEQRIKDLSIFSTQRGGKSYRCNIYYEPKLKGNVELSTNMSKPSDKEMWRIVKDMTLNDAKFKDTLVLLLSLTDDKISLKDISKRLDKYTKKKYPPASTGIYRLRVEKRKHSLNLRANWHRGKIYLEYGVDI